MPPKKGKKQADAVSTVSPPKLRLLDYQNFRHNMKKINAQLKLAEYTTDAQKMDYVIQAFDTMLDNSHEAWLRTEKAAFIKRKTEEAAGAGLDAMALDPPPPTWDEFTAWLKRTICPANMEFLETQKFINGEVRQGSQPYHQYVASFNNVLINMGDYEMPPVTLRLHFLNGLTDLKLRKRLNENLPESATFDQVVAKGFTYLSEKAYNKLKLSLSLTM